MFTAMMPICGLPGGAKRTLNIAGRVSINEAQLVRPYEASSISQQTDETAFS